jgi:hypothetical protein
MRFPHPVPAHTAAGACWESEVLRLALAKVLGTPGISASQINSEIKMSRGKYTCERRRFLLQINELIFVVKAPNGFRIQKIRVVP